MPTCPVLDCEGEGPLFCEFHWNLITPVDQNEIAELVVGNRKKLQKKLEQVCRKLEDL